MVWLIYEKKLFCSLDQHSEEASGIVGSFHWLSWATKEGTRDSSQFELYQGVRLINKVLEKELITKAE